MLFLINNPWVLVILFFVIGIIVYVGLIIKNEITMNRLLDNKQYSMRIEIHKKNPITKKIILLTSSALAPVLVIALVLSININNNSEPLGEVATFNDSKEVVDLHFDFVEKMETYSINNLLPKNPESVDTIPSYDASEDALDMAEGYVNDLGSDDYSRVNTQVVGVDEIDNAITDGKYIYTISGSDVIVTLAYTNSLESGALSNYKTITTVGDTILGMYIDSNRLVVVVEKENDVIVFVYNKLMDFTYEDSYEISGSYLGTRKINDDLFVITNETIPFEENIDLDQYLPSYKIDDNSEMRSQYQEITYSEGTYPDSFTTVFGIDLQNKEVDMEVVLGDSSYDLYVSNQNIYLTGNVYRFEPFTNLVDLGQPIAETKTAIMKFSILGYDSSYVTTGLVEGYALNQFSMDEYNGSLRIVTTATNSSFLPVNRLWILDSDLEVISVIGDGEGNQRLGEVGETVESSKCIQNYCYVVTFEQTDPFYVIDVTDVENPVIIGALKVPGYSSYLQPLSNDYMLGIGFGDNNGGTNGIKISIYDISDKSNPVVNDEFILSNDEYGYGWSSATYNHKDILVSIENGIIGLPYSFRDYIGSNYVYNSGILMFDIDDDFNITKSHYVSHETDSNHEMLVYKSLFIDDYLYTISNKYIMASLISTPEDIINSVTIDND